MWKKIQENWLAPCFIPKRPWTLFLANQKPQCILGTLSRGKCSNIYKHAGVMKAFKVWLEFFGERSRWKSISWPQQLLKELYSHFIPSAVNIPTKQRRPAFSVTSVLFKVVYGQHWQSAKENYKNLWRRQKDKTAVLRRPPEKYLFLHENLPVTSYLIRAQSPSSCMLT